MKAPRPEDCAVVMGKDDLDQLGRIHDATSTVDELASICGATVREEPHPQTGRMEKVADLNLMKPDGTLDRKKYGAFKEAMVPGWRMDTERQQGLDERRPKETLVSKDGRRKRVWTAVSQTVAEAHGMHAKWNMKATSIYRDGRWWKREGKEWVPDDRGCIGRSLLKGERKAPFGVVH